MATGPEHYREAEQRLEAAEYQRQRWGETENPNDLAASAWEMGLAAVHAQLAFAAATALSSRGNGVGMHELDYEAWDAVAGVQDDDSPYADLTIHDVMSAEELAEDDRAAEAYLDALDEERNAAHADHYEPGDELEHEADEDDDEHEDQEGGPF